MHYVATYLQALTEELLGEPVIPWIATRRSAHKSWRGIATELRKATGDRVDIHPATVKEWLDGDLEAAS